MKIKRCLFCLSPLNSEYIDVEPEGDFYKYECMCCGLVKASGSCAVLEQTEDHRHLKGVRHLISGILRWRAIRGVKDYRTIMLEDVPVLSQKEYTPKQIPEKIDLLIQYFGLISKSFGHVESFTRQFDKAVTFTMKS